MRQPDNADLRRILESLKDGHPEWARSIPDEPDRYEFPFGIYWIVYEVDETTEMETVISVALDV